MSIVFNLLIVIAVTVNANPVVHNQLVEMLHVMSTAPGDNRPAMMTITTTTTTRPSSSSTEKEEEHWNYEDTDSWATKYRDCAGEFQSPINIDPASAVRELYPRMVFGNYNKLAAENITNNGHTVLLHLPNNFPAEQLPFIMAGGLKDRYNFVQLHFHWGGDSTRGSEHLIGFKRYVGELHIVHYNSKYGSFSEASKHSDGLAVLAVLIELGQRDNVAMRHIVNQFQQVIHNGEETNLFSPIPIGDLLPDNVNNFYRYTGSLTTPRCQEIVIWTIFDTPIYVSERQLAQFRQLFDNEGHAMKDNFRPVHLRHGRIIMYRSEDGQPLHRNHHSGPVPLIKQRQPQQAVEGSIDWEEALKEYFYISDIPESVTSDDYSKINWQNFDHYNWIETSTAINNAQSSDGAQNSEYSYIQLGDDSQRSFQSISQNEKVNIQADTYLSFLSQLHFYGVSHTVTKYL